MKNWEKGPLYTFSYLDRETQEFSRLEPKLPNVCITHFFSDNGEINDFALEFQWGDFHINLIVHMTGIYVQELNVSCYVTRIKGGGELLELIRPIPSEVRKGIEPIYDQFKEFIKETSAFRLHFVTQEIVFEELTLLWA